MKNIKKYILILVGALLPLLAIAQKEQRESAVDPKAKTLLDKSLKAFDAKKGAVATFTSTTVNKRNNQTTTTDGTLVLKEDKFKFSVGDEVVTLFDGKTLSVLMLKEKEVTISEPDKEELSQVNPLLLIKSYQTEYKMRYIGEVQDGKKLCEKVELYPNDLKSKFSIISILVEKNTLQPQSISLKGKQGLITTFSINKIDRSQTVSAQEFVFDANKYSSFEVIDLR